jgi:hypothetical protein
MIGRWDVQHDVPQAAHRLSLSLILGAQWDKHLMQVAGMTIHNLAEAECRVALGERHISTQRVRVEQLKRDGHDPSQAKRLLATFQFSQRLFVERRDRLRNEISGPHGQIGIMGTTLAQRRGGLQGCGEMAERIRAYDWLSTPLGEITTWPSALTTLVELMLAHPYPSAIVCGPERILLYNDAADRVLAERSARVLGCAAGAAFERNRPLADTAFKRAFDGESVTLENMSFSEEMDAKGLRVHLTPVRDAAGAVTWVQLVAVETPSTIRAEHEPDASEPSFARSSTACLCSYGARTIAVNGLGRAISGRDTLV